MKTDNAELFREILLREKTKDAIPFLSKLDVKAKKEVGKKLRELAYVWEYNTKTVTSNGFTYQQTTTPKGSKPQQKIWALGSFFCHSLKDFSKNWGTRSYMSKDVLDEVLPIYCPSWFNTLINTLDQNRWPRVQLTYLELADLENKGYLTLSPELVVVKLPDVIRQSENVQGDWGKNRFVPENLWTYAITLEKHIWHLFEYESTIAGSNFFTYTNIEEKDGWHAAFKLLAKDRRIERKRLLKEAILATNRNFNKNISGWFADLFMALEPADGEIAGLLPEIFSLLSSPHSKVIGTALKLVKKVQNSPELSVEEFLTSAATLLTSETKSVVQSTQTILDQIAKKRPDLRRELCAIVVNAFVHSDGDIQKKASKFLKSYGADFEEEVLIALAPYQDTLMTDARHILSAALKTDISEDNSFQENKRVPLTLDDQYAPFEVTSNFDDFLFLASQAFDNNSPTHFDALLAGVLRVQPSMTGNHVDMLEPALQRALNKLTADWTASTGFLDIMLATFFVEYCELVCSIFPKNSTSLKKLIADARKKDVELAKTNKYYSRRILPLETWHTAGKTPIYQAFRTLCLLVLNRVMHNVNVPLLCAPTHDPCFINAEVLVSRVQEHQEQNIEIDEVDLQVALARCRKELVPQPGLEQLTGECRHLLEYFFNISEELPGNPKYQQAWIAASIGRGKGIPGQLLKIGSTRLNGDYLTGVMQWKTSIISFKADRWDFEKKRMVKYDSTRKELIVKRPKRVESAGVVSGLLGLFKAKPVFQKMDLSIYGDMQLREQWFNAQDNDISRFLSLIPHHPDPLIASVIEKTCRFPTFTSESEKRMVIKTLEFLAGSWTQYGRTSNEFLGICMMTSDATARTIAGEIWVNGVNTGTIWNEAIGGAIAKMCNEEFAPIKRFTDLAIGIYAISPLHKSAMAELLGGCFMQLPDEPVRNLKKLLELFKEAVHSSGKLSIDDVLRDKFSVWRKSKTLEGLIDAIVGEKASKM